MRLSVCACVVWVFGLASASAGAVGIEWVPVDNRGVIPGYDTYDLYIDTDGYWCCSALYFRLDQGSFYQDPFGLNTKLDPVFASFFPTVEFDTYVAEGDHLDLGVLGGALDVGGEPFLIFDEATLNLSWSSLDGLRSTGRFQILRVSITPDARGEWRMATIGGGIPKTTFTGTVEDIVPEPATIMLVLMGVAGSPFRTRRLPEQKSIMHHGSDTSGRGDKIVY